MSGAPPKEGAAEARSPLVRKLHRGEDILNLGILGLMSALPLLEIVGRKLGGRAIPGSASIVAMLTLWVGFTGAMLAARDGRHLSLSTGISLLKGNWALIVRVFRVAVGAAVTVILARSAQLVVLAEKETESTLPFGIPIWWALAFIPVAYLAVAGRMVLEALPSWKWRLLSFALAGGAVTAAALLGEDAAESLRWPLLGLVLLATGLGSPIFVALGGASLLLFWADGTPIAAVAAETIGHQMKSPVLPTIPLFTFAGYMLAESQASTRLVRVVRALVGMLPGGAAIMTVVVCAFFTTFTGASGVTILALGGLLFPILLKEGYPDRFSVGLLTSSGSIGLLFPPALPVILLAVVAKIPVDRMFVAGLLPGVVLVLALALYGAYIGVREKTVRVPFDWAEARSALWAAKWELLLPVLILGSFATGLATVLETAALTAAYAFVVEVFIQKDVKLSSLPRVGSECATLIGGVLIILGVALGLTNYLVDAEVPALALDWVEGHIESKYVFLIALNLFLLAVGCLMDIFSAISVVIPLILPISEHFGIDPLHLGVIFLANLELGYLTPPVGMNLFLASYRFEKPLTEVYRAAVPFLLILLFAVLVITYLPFLALAPVEWVFGGLPEAPPIKW